MSALIVGCNGIIGSALARALLGSILTTRRAGAEAKGRLFLDLTEPASWTLPQGVTEAYLCAGVTSVEECERDPQGTARVNVAHTLQLARRLMDAGAFVVFLSTNIVFSGGRAFGKATEEPDPLVEYGRQKLAVERGLAASDGAFASVRLTKVLPSRPKLFMNWLDRLKAGLAVEPFRDKVMAPVPLPFAVNVLATVGRRRLAGITQVSGPEDVTYEAIARYLAERAGADPALVRPKEGRPALANPSLAPSNTTLDTSRLRELGMTPPGTWETIEWSLS